MSGLTDGEREALRGLGQGQVPAVAERIISARESAAVEAFRAKAVAAIEDSAPRAPQMVDTKWFYELASARRTATFDAARIVRDLDTT